MQSHGKVPGLWFVLNRTFLKRLVNVWREFSFLSLFKTQDLALALKSLPRAERSLAWLCCTGANPTFHSCACCNFEFPLLPQLGGAPQGWEFLWGFVTHELNPAEDTSMCSPHPGESLPQLSSHPFTPADLPEGWWIWDVGHCCVGGTCFIPTMPESTCWVSSGRKLPCALWMGAAVRWAVRPQSPFSSLFPAGASSNSLSLPSFPLLVSSVNCSVMGTHKCLYLPSALQD